MFGWGVLKCVVHKIGTVLHPRPLNVHIFDTDPSLICVLKHRWAFQMLLTMLGVVFSHFVHKLKSPVRAWNSVQ